MISIQNLKMFATLHNEKQHKFFQKYKTVATNDICQTRYQRTWLLVNN